MGFLCLRSLHHLGLTHPAIHSYILGLIFTQPRFVFTGIEKKNPAIHSDILWPCLVCKKKLALATIAFLFIFDNYCSIINSKICLINYRKNCIIIFYFCLYIMLHIYI